MTVKDQMKNPGWYGIATGAIGLAVAIVGYLDTRAKAQRAETYRVEADAAIIENLNSRVEELEELVVELRISVGIIEGGNFPLTGGEEFAPVPLDDPYYEEESYGYGWGAGGGVAEATASEEGEEAAEEAASAEEEEAAEPTSGQLDTTPLPSTKQTKARKSAQKDDTRELQKMIRQRVY